MIIDSNYHDMKEDLQHHVVWQETEEAVSEPAISVRENFDVLEIKQGNNRLLLNYESLVPFAKLLMSIAKRKST